MDKTYRIAIVEDDKDFRGELEKYLNKYSEENKLNFQIIQFEDGADIVNDIERIGDHAENLADLTVQKINKKLLKAHKILLTTGVRESKL